MFREGQRVLVKDNYLCGSLIGKNIFILNILPNDSEPLVGTSKESHGVTCWYVNIKNIKSATKQIIVVVEA